MLACFDSLSPERMLSTVGVKEGCCHTVVAEAALSVAQAAAQGAGRHEVVVCWVPSTVGFRRRCDWQGCHELFELVVMAAPRLLQQHQACAVSAGVYLYCRFYALLAMQAPAVHSVLHELAQLYHTPSLCFTTATTLQWFAWTP